MKRIPALLTATCLALLLAACATPSPAVEYEGTSTTESASRDLHVALTLGNGMIRGTYTVGVAIGTLTGTVNGNLVVATLTPSTDCSYAFEGTLTDETFTGSFEPDVCPDGLPGTWDLTAR